MPLPVAITCGEPAGIGPEIAVAAWKALRGEVQMVWIGDPRHLPNGTSYQIVDDLSQMSCSAESLPVLAHPFAKESQAGVVAPENAQGVIDVIARAVDLAQTGQVCGICTAPIHKHALVEGADFQYPGHTEYLAALAGKREVVMMLASKNLRVVPATIHIALEDVITTLTPELLRGVITITHDGLQQQFGIEKPRIAVAGLNPHAGEGGLMGRQEVDWIANFLTDLRNEGFDICGPLPADTMFHAAARTRYDAAVAMYHDQALIPIKTLDFDKGVNVTLGLPFIRTSPDHGTAFDIAGRGIASPTSMIEAIRLCAKMANTRTNS